MKSIVEEASSIIKAVEKAWVRAGKPASFQIKVLEEPESKLFGLMGSSAKISFFFSEPEPRKRPARRDNRRERRQPAREARTEKIETRPERQAPRQRAQKNNTRHQQATQQPQKVAEARPEAAARTTPKIRWNDEMVQASKSWLNGTLKAMGLGSDIYTIEPKGYHLKVVFKSPLLADRTKEPQIFRSFAHLMMQMLRTRFKKGFTGFKIVLKGA